MKTSSSSVATGFVLSHITYSTVVSGSLFADMGNKEVQKSTKIEGIRECWDEKGDHQKASYKIEKAGIDVVYCQTHHAYCPGCFHRFPIEKIERHKETCK